MSKGFEVDGIFSYFLETVLCAIFYELISHDLFPSNWKAAREAPI